MLIEFRVENHRSLREERVLNLEEALGTDGGDPRPRQESGSSKRLLPVAALYGGNASGKTNVLAALVFMRNAVLFSHRLWPAEGGVPRDPFAWGPKREEPSLFEVTFTASGTRFDYGFVADDERFLEEWLYARPQNRRQMWFERDEEGIRFGENLRGENRAIEQITRPNSLFLAAAAQSRHAQLTPIIGFFRSIKPVRVHGRGGGWGEPSLEIGLAHFLTRGVQGELAFFDEDRPFTRGATLDGFGALMNILQVADTGVVDLKVERTRERDMGPRNPRVFLRHHSETGEAWLPLEEESRGTRSLLRMAPYLVEALAKGHCLVVDELEASLHPLLALHVVRTFNDPRTNPNNAQLLFSTHDTSLLGTTLGDPVLRRDQVWLTEKDAEGGTDLYPLTDYKPRKAENLERGYLSGRYGAIPFLGAELARTLPEEQ
jgi:hypothetical protein